MTPWQGNDFVFSVRHPFWPLHDWLLWLKHNDIKCFDGLDPYENWLPPRQWQYSINVMLEKSNSNYNLAKLWIHLFEVDFNFSSKWLGKTAISKTESQWLLAHEQYGSWKVKAATTQCLNKCLWYNYMHFQQEPAALCSNSSKGCYDRIVPLAAVLCLCHWGTPLMVVATWLQHLECQWYKIHIQMNLPGIEPQQSQDIG